MFFDLVMFFKVLYATPTQDGFYDITDALEEQGMEQIIKVKPIHIQMFISTLSILGMLLGAVSRGVYIFFQIMTS